VVDVKLIEPDQLEQAAEALEGGELVVVPTRRWYMICGDARNPDACERIYTGKQRRPGKALAFVTPSYETTAALFVTNVHAKRLIEAFWPGDLALILPWRDPAVGQHHATVGTPNALVVQEAGVLGELARLARVPIAAASANISGEAGAPGPGPAITVDEVRTFVVDGSVDVALCINGGICPAAHHLTIVDCASDHADLVRPGVVHERAIAAALAEPLQP
jgi:L-threonylcarbamoyladenylate synthase